MPILKWDADDFLYCLEVDPILKDDGLEFHYEVKKAGLTLDLVVIPYRRLVSVAIFQENVTFPLISFWLFITDGISYEKDKRGEHLRFRGCKIVEDDYYADDELIEAPNHSKGFDLTVELFIKPTIRLNLA